MFPAKGDPVVLHRFTVNGFVFLTSSSSYFSSLWGSAARTIGSVKRPSLQPPLSDTRSFQSYSFYTSFFVKSSHFIRGLPSGLSPVGLFSNTAGTPAKHVQPTVVFYFLSSPTRSAYEKVIVVHYLFIICSTHCY